MFALPANTLVSSLRSTPGLVDCYHFLSFPRLLDRRPLVNCDLPDQILQGALVMKPNLRAFRDSGVVFEDGTVEENIDAVVFCTGYKASFPFLPPALSGGPDKELTLYK